MLVRPDKSDPQTFILFESARQYYWQGEGAYSLKTFYNGTATYRAGLARYSVDSSCHLILNEGQTYSVEIQSTQPVESFCIFFSPELVVDVYRNCNNTAEKLLDLPEGARDLPAFYQRTYPKDIAIAAELARIKTLFQRSPRQADPQLAEVLHAIMGRMLTMQGMARAEAISVGALKLSTRDELYRRVYRAKDYIDAGFREPLPLRQLARVACLSPNHLLRTFRALFKTTPHQYLVTRRLSQAQHLLRTTKLTVSEICYSVGFESHGSFSALFRRQVGVPPQSFRAQRINRKINDSPRQRGKAQKG